MVSDRNRSNVILTGFMATGKSSVGRRLAARLGYQFVDVDDLVAAEAGVSIPEIFRTQGEAAFRSLEARMVSRTAEMRRCVIAAGGGAIAEPENLAAFRRSGVILALTADPETILRRIGPGNDRPMLWGADRRERVEALLAQRAPAYAQADFSVDTSRRSIDEVADCIMTVLDLPFGSAPDGPQPASDTVCVNLAGRSYEVRVGADLLPRLGEFLQPLGLGRQLGLVTHPALGDAFGYARRVVESLVAAGYLVDCVSVPPGEGSKSLEEAGRLARRLVQARLDRGSAILGLGGGVIGDLAGFVAAILFRGIPFINLPTTLLAQVDSSIGGKTGVNLPEGKNLLGAFHQPRLVVADVLTLRTMEEREFRSGLAEVVKHAMIADAELFDLLERETVRILARDPEILRPLVARSCAIKARVVEADEREGGQRAVLNFGHTVGHALEAALGYGKITHGEAVAQGMLVAAAVSVHRGLCPERDAERLRVLLRRLGLLDAPLPSSESLEIYVLRDKKARDGVVQFVLTHGVGSVTLAPIFDLAEIRAALRNAL